MSASNFVPLTMAESTKKKKNYKSLATLLRHFVGLEIKVELKTGRIYEGTLSEADQSMNVTLEGSSSSSQSYQTVSIRGSTIRYIHFPDQIDLSATIKQSMDREKSASERYKRHSRTK